MENLVFQNSNGNDVTTSLLVAEVFGKEHSKVVRDIESLSCSASFNAANFGVITYIDSRNREQTAYEMTKDGFSFLVMGYTGAKAGEFKERLSMSSTNGKHCSKMTITSLCVPSRFCRKGLRTYKPKTSVLNSRTHYKKNNYAKQPRKCSTWITSCNPSTLIRPRRLQKRLGWMPPSSTRHSKSER